MEVIVNQQNFTVSAACSVAQLLADTLDRPPTGIAVAVNQTIVPKANWNSHVLNSGDHIVLITATQGG
jgi:sulfur carrier protein